MAQAVSDVSPSTLSKSRSNGKGDRVLIVEDDADLNGLLCDLLRTEGYDAIQAEDGDQAVQVVAENPPDAIVLDIMLPGMNGFEVCQRLKFRRETNLIPILMLTALDDDKARGKGLRVGADRYLTKPFEPDELLREIRSTLDHRRKMQEGNVSTAIQFQMHSDGRLREQLNDMLSELFMQTPLSEEDIGRIRYAVLEMVQNAVEWGNRNDSDLEVSVSYVVTKDLV
jgi:two-component system, OmpR family, response regulator